ncbi:MAG: NAD(P)H-dependent oxidoreductase [Wenzhouxiangella sp.]
MPKNILLIEGHPDESAPHFCHALAAAYRQGAEAAGHSVSELRIGSLSFPLLRSEAEWSAGAIPESLLPAQDLIRAADHLVFIYPVWLGTMPALLKGFLEQVFRPGFALDEAARKGPGGLRPLKGKSARVIVTMGMPGFVYRWFYRAHGYRYFKRNILHFVGIRPVRQSFVGMAAAKDDRGRQRWLQRVQALGHLGG